MNKIKPYLGTAVVVVIVMIVVGLIKPKLPSSISKLLP